MPVIGVALVGAAISSAITLTPFVTNLALAANSGALTFASRKRIN